MSNLSFEIDLGNEEIICPLRVELLDHIGSCPLRVELRGFMYSFNPSSVSKKLLIVFIFWDIFSKFHYNDRWFSWSFKLQLRCSQTQPAHMCKRIEIPIMSPIVNMVWGDLSDQESLHYDNELRYSCEFQTILYELNDYGGVHNLELLIISH